MSKEPSYSELKEVFNAGYQDKIVETLYPLFNQQKLTDPALLLMLIQSLRAVNKFSELQAVITYLLSFRASNILEHQLKAQIVLGHVYLQEGKLDEARKLIERVTAQNVDKNPDIIVASQELLSLVIQTNGNMEDAIATLQRALDVYEYRCSPETLARSYSSLGNHYGQAGFQKKAIEAYQKSYEISVREKLINSQLTTLNNLSASYYELDNYEKSIEYLKELRFISPNKNSASYITAGCNMGHIYVDWGKLEEAKALYEQSLVSSRQNNLKRFESLALIGLAYVEYVYSEYDKAEAYLDLSGNLASQLKARDMISYCLELRSKINARKGKFDVAIQLIEKNLTIKEENRIFEGILNDYALAIEYYLEINNINKVNELRTRMSQHASEVGEVVNRWLMAIDADIAFRNNDFGTAKIKFLVVAKEYENKELRELQIRSYLKVAKLSLLIALFQESSESTAIEINNAYFYVQKAVEIAEGIHDSHYILESLLSKSTIELAKGELLTAIRTITYAQAYTAEKKLVNYQQRIARRLAEIKDIESLENSQDSVMISHFWHRQGLRTALNGIKEALSHVDPLLNVEKSQIFTNVVFYRFASIGPELFYSETSIDSALGLSTGVFLYTSIGQGGNYRTGLFGPLPWGKKENEVAIIHSQMVSDLHPPDPRFGMSNFVIIALVTQQDKTHFIDRKELENILSEQLRSITDLSTTTNRTLGNIVQVIRNRGW